MCNLLLNPAADAVSVRCLLPPRLQDPLCLSWVWALPGLSGKWFWCPGCAGAAQVPPQPRATGGQVPAGSGVGIKRACRGCPPELHGKSSTKIEFYVNLFCPKR